MRPTLARILIAVLATSCSSHRAADDKVPPLDLSSVRTHASDEPPPPAEEDKPADEELASDGAGAHMALEEGKLGKQDPALAREQAIEAARNAGVLGTGNAQVSSGFDGASIYGSLEGQSGGGIGLGQYGTIGKGSGTGAGYGVGGGRGGMRARSAGPSADAISAEAYKDYGQNAWTDTAADHLSTFAADVDTASYTIMRRKLTEGALPPREAVRVEELLNYFKYTYADPAPGQPFSVTMDVTPSPFSAKRHILRVGVSSKPVSIRERKPAHLVFLVDVSGSMYSPDKLPLAKRSLRILVDNLHDGDTVAMVTYAGSTRVVLPPTGLDQRGKILAAIEDLNASGSTAMGDGIKLAYAQAAKGLTPDAVSRVIVLSDGDANVGRTKHGDILETIAGHVKQGVTLSTIGFGMGNYKDELMEQLANKGNGNNFYIDGLSAAKRVFQEQLGATLEVVAKDVKLQVDFDPTQVRRYRLIGYENRDVRDQDFRDDKVDAGEIGAGHQVTALYELELADASSASASTIVTARVRHKAPHKDVATEAAFPVTRAAIAPSFKQASADLRFAFAVAAFADVLRGGADAKGWDLQAIKTFATEATNGSADRKELVTLIDRAIRLRTARTP